jgi:hypothetical protein
MNREAFEAYYASSHDLPLDTFSQYRMGDTYRLPGIASHWRTWQMALESVVIHPFAVYRVDGCKYYDADSVDDSLEDAGLKVAK